MPSCQWGGLLHPGAFCAPGHRHWLPCPLRNCFLLHRDYGPAQVKATPWIFPPSSGCNQTFTNGVWSQPWEGDPLPSLSFSGHSPSALPYALEFFLYFYSFLSLLNNLFNETSSVHMTVWLVSSFICGCYHGGGIARGDTEDGQQTEGMIKVQWCLVPGPYWVLLF